MATNWQDAPGRVLSFLGRNVALPGRPIRRLERRLRRPPKQARQIVGIASTGHGASLAYVGPDGLIRSSVLDRWAGEKHVLLLARAEDESFRKPRSPIDQEIASILSYSRGGKFPPSLIFEDTVGPWFDWLVGDLKVKPNQIDLVVTSDSHFATNGFRLGHELNRWFPAARIVRDLEHHEVHRRQAFWQSGFEEAAVLTLDSCGEDLERIGNRKLSGTIARMNRRGEEEVPSEFFWPDNSAGYLYDVITQHVGFPQGDEGKTMGLAPYGGPELFDILRPRLELNDDGGFSFPWGPRLQELLDEYVPARAADEELLERHMNVAFAGQALLELIVSNAFSAGMRRTGLKDIAYAGGVALNSVANGKAYAETGVRNLYVAPNPGDPGHALGCALFGAYELSEKIPRSPEVHEYLGPDYSIDQIEAALRVTSYSCTRPERLEPLVARVLANGYIVARFDGPAEFGPRALGNRSILCDPRPPHMKDVLNARVKHRESFRPFAPTVLEHRASEFFEMDGRSAYMLRVVPVRPDKRALIPAVVHVDGTARVQTLNRAENPKLYQIIEEFDRLTGVPVVLNTSFNLAGKPIVETPAHALECFAATEIDVLVVGPFVVSKRPIQEFVDRPREN